MIRSLSRFCVPLLAAAVLADCVTTRFGDRIDHLPMYGQPGIPRPEFARKGDEDFIRQASGALGGREAASRAWWTQAERYMNDGNLDFAMRRYNQSWLLDPDNYQPYWGFGRVMIEVNKPDEAIAHLEKAVQLCKDDFQKVALLSDLGSAHTFKTTLLPADQQAEKARHFGLAGQRFAQSTGIDASYPYSWLRWSHALFLEGKYPEAWEKLKKARALGARNWERMAALISQKMPEPQ